MTKMKRLRRARGNRRQIAGGDAYFRECGVSWLISRLTQARSPPCERR
ncbi:hypothetical protein KCP73_00900 [Salmonella enterica subsp. enterica]|nr:hypothetical protein KCP73_00900 [Salmonella enterica subsp. enterica]